MSRDFKLEKRLILAAVALLIMGDIALAVYTWRMAATPRSQQELANLTRNRDLLRADIKRGQDIRQKIPAIAKDCDQFEQSLVPESTGYSQYRQSWVQWLRSPDCNWRAGRSSRNR